jgi:alkylation response protein AidB-like acyl-CoA dehydrogenase
MPQPTPEALVARARAIGDDLLFPTALDTDASPLLSRTHLDAIADAGLYGIAGPIYAGGSNLDIDPFCDIVAALASGCLTTAFVWVQHHGVVRAVATSPNAALTDEWLPRLCSGETRAGVALVGMLNGPPLLTARRLEGGWQLDGFAPWMTGWGRLDAIHVAARNADSEGELVRLLVDATEAPTLRATPVPMAAVNASGTVRLDFARHLVPESRLIATEPYEGWGPLLAASLRVNGSLSVGVAERCCALLGPTALDDELATRRAALATATNATIADARAGISEFAMRAASALMADGGSRAILLDRHAQRLAREAMFLLVFGQRPPIREALLTRLGAVPRDA